MNVFFSKVNIEKLINYKGLSEIDLQTYSTVIEKIKQIQLEFLSEVKSKSNSITSKGK